MGLGLGEREPEKIKIDSRGSARRREGEGGEEEEELMDELEVELDRPFGPPPDEDSSSARTINKDHNTYFLDLNHHLTTTTTTHHHHHPSSSSSPPSLLIDLNDHQLNLPSDFLSSDYHHPSSDYHQARFDRPQAIDPNAILHRSLLLDHHFNPTDSIIELIPSQPDHHHPPSIHPPSTTPTYALDPALLSATIPSRSTLSTTSTPTITIATGTTDTLSPTHPDHSLHPRLPILRIANPKLRLSHRSSPPAPVPSPTFEREDDRIERPKDSHKNDHSPYSSSSIILPQTFPSTSSDHLRTSSHPLTLLNAPDWEDKPSAEEYKMLSSKEKRQLRNKISARNFRHRRKQHISTLEQQVAQRDQAIESLSHDLSAVRMENKELKSQVEMLKQKWADLMKKIEEMSLATGPSGTSSPTHPIPTSPPSSSSAIAPISPRMRSAKSSTLIPLPNLHKDLGSHSRKPFNGVGGMAGGNVGVHTTLIPEVSVDVYQSASSALPHPNPLGEKLTQSDLSPQALIELQLETHRYRPLTHTIVTTCDPTDAKPQGDEPNPKVVFSKKPPSIIPPSTQHDHQLVITGQSLDDHQEKELGDRLSRMLHDALKIDEEDDDETSASSSMIDPEKLKGCMDGRLVFQLVERSPPPYPVDFNPAQPRSSWAKGMSSDRSPGSSSTLASDLLSRKITGVRL